ncbi:hypothetical protein ABW19_dt0200334 [Dactylella cylindrospora]|nr:hypothetical protein ABW19_dt0200334 [Dactylella cylindrospora]
MHPMKIFGPEGLEIIKGSETHNLIRTSRSMPGEMAVLGLPFLSAAYLSVNYEDSTFTLSPAATYIPTNKEITAIFHPSCILEPIKDKLSKGAIAGISVGAAAGVSLIVLGVYILWRRKWRHPVIPDLPPPTPATFATATTLVEKGGGEIHQSAGNEIFHLSGNEISHMSDHFPEDRGCIIPGNVHEIG